MLNGPDFAALLHRRGFAFATGVPCSLIETVIGALEREAPLPYVPAVREDVAVGLAAGAWLAGKRPVVLMQNSGLGTSMNALASMALMYGIPMLLVVTWRGYQGKDAPEHILTGAITPQHLDLLGIPHRALTAASASEDLGWAVAEMNRLSQPVALLVPPGIFEGGHEMTGAPRMAGSHLAQATTSPRRVGAEDAPVLTASISRFVAIRAAVKALSDQPVVHANGYPARESHAVLDRPQNFYMIGSMGLASAIALGISLNHSARHTVVFDGDGNLLMNLGILAMVGARAPERLVHCVFDNEVYGSTGNQESAAPGVRLDRLAAAAGYRTAVAAASEDEIGRAVASALRTPGPHFILAKVTPEQADVPRIAHTPAQIRDRFRAALASS